MAEGNGTVNLSNIQNESNHYEATDLKQGNANNNHISDSCLVDLTDPRQGTENNHCTTAEIVEFDSLKHNYDTSTSNCQTKSRTDIDNMQGTTDNKTDVCVDEVLASLSATNKDDSGICVDKPLNLSTDSNHTYKTDAAMSETESATSLISSSIRRETGNEGCNNVSDFEREIHGPVLPSPSNLTNNDENNGGTDLIESLDIENNFALDPRVSGDGDVNKDIDVEMPGIQNIDILNEATDIGQPDPTGHFQDGVDSADSEISHGTYDVTHITAESDEEEDIIQVIRRKRRIDSSSDNDSDNDDEETQSKKSAKSSSSDDAGDTENGKPSPKHNWFVLPELWHREQGYGNRQSSSKFHVNTYGSLQMVQRLKIEAKMEYHDGCVNALHFNRSGTLLASGSDDLNVCIWNWQEKRPHLIFDSGHRSNVFQCKFMQYGGDCHVVTCARDGQIRLAELSVTGVCKGTKKLGQHKGAAHKLALLNDEPHVFLSCGEDAVTLEIDVRVDKPNRLTLTKENDHKVPLYSIHANPLNSSEFCVGGRDHYIRIYDRRKITGDDSGPVKKYCPHHLIGQDSIKANVTCAVFNYNGTEVLGTYNDEDIYLFDASHSDGADYIHRYTGHRNNATVKGVNFYGPCSEYIVSGSDCGNIFLWDKTTEHIVQYMDGDKGGVVNVLEPHPHMPILATSGLDHDVKIWTPTSYEPTNLAEINRVIKKNKKQREEERLHEPEMIDGQMLWFLMHHLRRSARRRARREEGQDISDSSDENSDSNSDSDDDDDEDDDDVGGPRVGCAPS